ncbi:hypothetical protein CWI42_011710 [Ordospora colligata]|uniref:t-SNARE coiled-coil homology domain-containing protein n=1 Tax=Ordospora colligata OC4 TaxID=1354746 RepID=A0A0B2UHG0_9MICR|nr:uncharacterized protein M896_011710 [Ordospora colligata OC4]KHN70516.1 hypothetical protein M896_011710 [Ordospora colligata OC4]TBU17266.1 hypothetical protein CWI41_011710 [Ordospora colligata]TBU17516.1 hypothetical protein CWI40_011710 [Ordospora colligata]TBU19696.1 hypothetical protein CWI42_011710 [Ordospora colligata]
MDRTDEYMRIVGSTRIPQQSRVDIQSPYSKAFEMDAAARKMLGELENALEKGKVYESFTLQSKMDRVREFVKEMRNTSCAGENARNDQEEASYCNLDAMIKHRAARHLLKLSELARKRESRHQEIVERRKDFDSECIRECQDVVFMENEVTTERIKERQNISMQISEIGQIMEEISMHVSLQEESFKRIDEMMGTSDTLISGSLDLLRKTLENVSKTRSSIFKFFLFWLLLLLLIWLIRR